MNSIHPRLEAQDFAGMHSRLRELYRTEYPDGAPHLYEQLLRRIPDYIGALVRRKLDLLTQEETGEDTKKHTDLTRDEKRQLAPFLDMQVTRAHLEVGRDAALSNEHHTIAHFDTQPPIVAHQLIDVAANSNPESMRKLERLGCIFFDVDGTKTIVDCTSHAHAGRYLEGLGAFLCQLPDEVQLWLKERKLKTEAFSVAGDEYIILVRSEDQSITQEMLTECSRKIQDAISTDPILTSFITFDDPEFVMEYDEWSDQEREQYRSDARSMQKKLRESRSKLPDRFLPSVSCGSSTFMEALGEALSPDTEEAKTLEELGVNAFRLMVSKADERLGVDKKTFREQMTDPTWKSFLLRNTENRRLQTDNDQLRAENEHLKAEVNSLRSRLRELGITLED